MTKIKNRKVLSPNKTDDPEKKQLLIQNLELSILVDKLKARIKTLQSKLHEHKIHK